MHHLTGILLFGFGAQWFVPCLNLSIFDSGDGVGVAHFTVAELLISEIYFIAPPTLVIVPSIVFI